MSVFKLFLSLLLVSGFSLLYGQEVPSPVIQNVGGRYTVSLDGLWQAIVDPLENGYYNHRYLPKPNGYFKNAKMQKPSDLIESIRRINAMY